MDFRSDFDGLAFRLGDTVKDDVTGIKGTAVTLYVPLSASRRVGIEPKSKDGIEIPKGIEVDVIRVELVEEGKHRLDPSRVRYDENVDFTLGDAVKDELTKLEGHVQGRHYSLSGCVNYAIVHLDKMFGGTRAELIDQARLRKNPSGQSHAEKFKQEDTGGPSTYFSSAMD